MCEYAGLRSWSEETEDVDQLRMRKSKLLTGLWKLGAESGEKA